MPSRTLIIIVVAAIASTVVIPIVAIAFAAVIAIGAPKLIGQAHMYTIVSQLYYRPVAQRIIHDDVFARELGSPISIDDQNVSCGAVDNNKYESTADCDIPVSGPRKSGFVHAQIDAKASSIKTDLYLHVGSNRVLEAHEDDYMPRVRLIGDRSRARSFRRRRSA
jgi:hypothetical protein